MGGHGFVKYHFFRAKMAVVMSYLRLEYVYGHLGKNKLYQFYVTTILHFELITQK